ncbi:RNase P modulator RnpM [Wukongibacter sp. M2B1]|uniref:RNase P modulator RnpM n=1 Tax=Wukongibacter sp. M2B1 TaxID=3088895 RepID=UPI003D7A3B75
MTKRKIPLRKCVGCNEQKSKKELIRIVKNKDGEMNVDFTGKAHGRGAYICPNEDCLKAAQKRKSLNRAFSQEIPDEIYEKLTEELKKNEG